MPITYNEKSYAEVMTWTAETQIQYAPNRKSGKSFHRYGEYMKAKTVGEALERGSYGADLLFDFEKGLVWATGGPKRERPPEIKGVSKEELKALCKTDLMLGKMYDKWQMWKANFSALEASGMTRQELQAANEEQDPEGSKDSILIAIGRRKAQERARAILQAVEQDGGRAVTDDELLSCLQLWAFKENTNRTNVTPDGESFVYSDTIGLIKMMTCEKTLLTLGTRRYPEFTMLISRWLSDRLPEELQGKFAFTSVNINKNYAGKLHRDSNNQGPSLIKAFGDFEGGELNYWPSDDKKTPLEEFDNSEKIAVNIKDNLLLFDGNRGHFVNPFKGERYTLVFFSVRTWDKVPKEDASEAARCGIMVPKKDTMKKALCLLGPSGPAGYRVWALQPDGPEGKPRAATPPAPPVAAAAEGAAREVAATVAETREEVVQQESEQQAPVDLVEVEDGDDEVDEASRTWREEAAALKAELGLPMSGGGVDGRADSVNAIMAVDSTASHGAAISKAAAEDESQAEHGQEGSNSVSEAMVVDQHHLSGAAATPEAAVEEESAERRRESGDSTGEAKAVGETSSAGAAVASNAAAEESRAEHRHEDGADLAGEAMAVEENPSAGNTTSQAAVDEERQAERRQEGGASAGEAMVVDESSSASAAASAAAADEVSAQLRARVAELEAQLAATRAAGSAVAAAPAAPRPAAARRRSAGPARPGPSAEEEPSTPAKGKKASVVASRSMKGRRGRRPAAEATTKPLLAKPDTPPKNAAQPRGRPGRSTKPAGEKLLQVDTPPVKILRGKLARERKATGIAIGARVRLTGLEQAPELNNAEGSVVALDEKRGRWAVELDGGKGTKHLLVGNLSVLGGAANEGSPATAWPPLGARSMLGAVKRSASDESAKPAKARRRLAAGPAARRQRTK